MPQPLRHIPAWSLLGLLCGCQAALPGRPPGPGLFPTGAAPRLPQVEAGPLWMFLAGVVVGALIYRLLRRRAGRRREGDLARLRGALAVLEDIVAGCRRSGVVVSMSQWLKRRQR